MLHILRIVLLSTLLHFTYLVNGQSRHIDYSLRHKEVDSLVRNTDSLIEKGEYVRFKYVFHGLWALSFGLQSI